MSTESLRLLHGSSYVLEGAVNIGVYEQNGSAYVIDTGQDKNSGKKIRKVLDEKGWTLAAVINTHSHADHAGGNEYLQNQYGCDLWATKTERAFIEEPHLEAAFLWGGFAVKELKSRFFEAAPSRVTHFIPENGLIASGLTTIPLAGHFFSPVGIVTEDRVCYLGDSLLGENILHKHAVPFIYDIAAYKETLLFVPSIDADFFVPSHGNVENVHGITRLAHRNLEAVLTVENAVLNACAKKEDGSAFDDILSRVCTALGFELTLAQYALTGSTVKSLLSYLHAEGKISYGISENKLVWKLA